MAGSNSFVWEHLSSDANTGYAASILNSLSAANANGVLIRTTNTASTSKIFTANSNGTDRMTILGNGNVGIGTNIP